MQASDGTTMRASRLTAAALTVGLHLLVIWLVQALPGRPLQLDGAPVVSTVARILVPGGAPGDMPVSVPPPAIAVSLPPARLETPAIRLAAPAGQPSPLLSGRSVAASAGRSGRDDYIARIQAHLDGFRRQAEAGLVYVRFSLDRGGRVQDVVLERSSGRAELDQEALRLVRVASPLPPVPPALAGQTFTVTMPIAFGPRPS